MEKGRPGPWPRSYWVDDHLIAGAYPGAPGNAEAEDKVRALVAAGVTLFVDLTTPADRLRPYESLLATIDNSAKIRRVSLPVPDLSVAPYATVEEALRLLDAEAAAGGISYVHCWGGIGRTGTIIGCHLARRVGGGAALAALTQLRAAYPDAQRPSPETPDQAEFVRRWPRTDDDRVLGCLLAGAIGDALGNPLEFESLKTIRRRDRLPPPRLVTDDTQMTLFTAEGLLRAALHSVGNGATNLINMVGHAYLRWLHTQGQSWSAIRARSGLPTLTDRPDGWLVQEAWLHHRRAPGNTCLGALMTGTFGTIDNPINDSKGCGGVMRAAPAGFLADDIEHAFRIGAETAAITHGHPSGYWSAGALAAMVHALLGGVDLPEAIETARALAADANQGDETADAIAAAVAVAKPGVPSSEDLESLGGGWVGEEALAIAVACALAADEIGVEAAITLAVTHSGDSDSTGSICGNLLGAMHGTTALPSAWVDSVEGGDTIRRLAADCTTARHDGLNPNEPSVSSSYPSG